MDKWIEELRMLYRLPLRLLRLPIMDNLVRDLLERKLMIFLGAGASISVLPGGVQLAKMLSIDLQTRHGIKLNKQEQGNLSIVAKRYEQEFGRKALILFIKDKLSGGSPSEIHRLVAELGCHSIVTTNYDTLQEEAIVHLGKTVKRIATITDLVISEEAPTKVLKLHGSIDVPDTEGEGIGLSKAECAPFIITEDDYYSNFISQQYHHPFESLLISWLFTYRCLFIGYRLADPNFERIIHYLHLVLKYYGISDKIQFCAVMKNASESKVLAWRGRGLEIVNCDASVFLNTLADYAVLQLVK